MSIRRFAAVFLSALFVGCHESNPGAGSSGPRIEFIHVPLAEPGNPNELTTIGGRVVGAQPSQQIVLYAKSQDTWYVQPYAIQPFTRIRPDSTWSSPTHPGQEYAALLVGPQFHVAAITPVLPVAGVIASRVIKGKPPLLLRWWALTIYAVLGLLGVFGLHRLRLIQMTRKLNVRFEERLAERTRVAQLLHDTLLQGVISSSMQLNVALEQLPTDSPAIGKLHRVLESMGQVVEEGRNTLRGLQTPTESLLDLEQSWSRIPEEEKLDGDVRVRVSGPAVPLRSNVRSGLCSFGRAALTQAFRDSEARNAEVELRYTASELRLMVRHDGSAAGQAALSGMRVHAERIGARFRRRRFWRGNEIELRIAAPAAFESHSEHHGSGPLEVE